jgi:hypothetical protein
MKQKRFMSLGLVFVIVGVLWLLQEAGFISGSTLGYLIPILVILLGLDMMQRTANRSNFWFNCCNPNQSPKNKKDHKIVDEQ